ncbi:MAG TPA: hypothetical protein ENG42_03715, partial [Candidatus Aenigmarchaeota archaeon]|nr:hypothetical protein [Candidatus Aenigmarchaeota archaeon]
FDIMPNGDDKNVMSKIRTLIKEAEKSYSTCNLKNVVRCINEIAATGNKYFQENEPWKIVKSDTKRCATVLAIAANIVKNLVILLKPIMPNFSAQIESQLRLKQLSWSDLNFGLKNHKIAKPKIILKKIEKLAFSDPFMKLELKIGKIREVFDHPDANKLYVLRVDIGGEIRNIVAGLKQNYGKRDLLGKHIVVLTNLKHANIRGVKSEGMVLAAGNEKDWGVLLAKGKAGEAVYVEGIAPRPAREITIKEFSKLELVSKNGKVFYKGFPLRTAKGFVIADKNIDGRVR